MDPYLEGYLWPDVHHRLASEIARRLGAQIRPRYVARLEITVVEDIYPEVEIGVMYPDVEVLLAQRPSTLHEPAPTLSTDLIAPIILPLMNPVPLRIASVEVRDVANNELVTSIEILSPVNKREPGLTKYREKQRRLREGRIHVLEIDWLRRGIRPLQHPRLPESAYLIILIRAQSAQAELWPISLPDTLPTVPVPLRPPDLDARLEFGPILQTIYDEAGYDLSIDYAQPPPPPELSADEIAWMQTIHRTANS